MTKFYWILAASVSLFLVSCTHTSKIEQFAYADKLASKFNPRLREGLDQDIEKLKAKGITPQHLSSPENEVSFLIEIKKTGQIRTVKTARKSQYSFLNVTARKAIVDSSPLPAPPESCFENGVCVITYNFAVNL